MMWALIKPCFQFWLLWKAWNISSRRDDNFRGRAKSDMSHTSNAYGHREARHEYDSFNRGSRKSVDSINRGKYGECY